jgi:hypothetical protein
VWWLWFIALSLAVGVVVTTIVKLAWPRAASF